MPRRPRLDLPNTVYHIYIRGHNKSPIFMDDLDRRTFLNYLARASDCCPWELLGYCLMPNHYHLQVKTLEGPLSLTMHRLNLLYASYFNFRYRTVGHVFQNRYHSIPVEVDAYLLQLSRYIHLNPVEAGIVEHPEDFEWSSYKNYLGMRPLGMIKSALVLDTVSSTGMNQGEVYRKFVEDELGKKSTITEQLIRQTRIFGSAGFIKSIYAQKPEAFPQRISRSTESAF